jgi:hypothetical protein
MFHPFVAHDVLEGIRKFIHDCVPYEFIRFVSAISDVFADNFDLVIDPISDFGSSHECEK